MLPRYTMSHPYHSKTIHHINVVNNRVLPENAGFNKLLDTLSGDKRSGNLTCTNNTGKNIISGFSKRFQNVFYYYLIPTSRLLLDLV